jgi:hypothetical protein
MHEGVLKDTTGASLVALDKHLALPLAKFKPFNDATGSRYSLISENHSYEGQSDPSLLFTELVNLIHATCP